MSQQPPLFNVTFPYRSLGALVGLVGVYWVLLWLLSSPQTAEAEQQPKPETDG